MDLVEDGLVVLVVAEDLQVVYWLLGCGPIRPVGTAITVKVRELLQDAS